MRIGVISDTHGKRELARLIVQDMGPIDMLLHAGDHYEDALYLSANFPFAVFGVKGNCDYSGTAEQIIEAGDIKVLLTHGHQYNVKSSLQKLAYRAQELAVKIVVFGHTHTPETEWYNGILFFNPGSITRSRGLHSKPSYGIIELEKSHIKPQHKTFDEIS